MKFGLFALVCTVIGAAPALAQGVLMWPAQGTAELRDTEGVAARDAVRQGLVSAGHEVEFLEIEPGSCVDGTCVRETLEGHSASLAAFVAVWARAGEESASEVTVTLRSADGIDHGHRSVVNTDVATAARQALAGALSNMAGSRRAEVTVRSVPSGAALTVDGSPHGQTPTRVELETGSHTFSASLEGHHSARRRVDITEDTDVRLELESLGEPLGAELGPQRGDPVAKRRRIRGLGIALGVAGVGGLATTLAVTIPKIECTESIPGGCRGRELSVGRFAGWMALSGVATVLGIIVFVSAPDAPSEGTSSVRTEVAVRPTGVEFTLSF